MARAKNTDTEQAEKKTHDDGAEHSASPDLVRMSKAGDTIDVHPSCVAAHKAAGWVEG